MDQLKVEQQSSEQDPTQASNGANTNNNSSVSPSPASAESKKERSKDSGRDNGRNSRRDRERNRARRRSRSPVRPREDRMGKISRRVYVANIPFDVRWGELKDLFRDKVGNVRFCQLFENEEGKPRGCGLVEFEDSASAKKAIEALNRYELRGRELVVKEDLDIERDRFGRLLLHSSKREIRNRDSRRESYDDRHYRNGSDSVSGSGSGSYNTYGLSPQFLSSLGVKGPLNNRIFVANLDYKVSERKLEDIFRLAGKITRVKLYFDNDGKSKGFGVVEFDHPVEAVQAISMFNNQKLYDRILSVRLDKFDIEDPFTGEAISSKLPTGLEGIGKGLGIGGQPLNITKSMLSNQGPMANPIGGGQSAGVTPGIVAPSAVAPQAASAAITALTNLAGNLQNLPNLAQSLAQLSSSTGPLPNTAMPPSGYPSSTNELAPPPAPGPSAYPGYQPVPPVNPASQPAYVTNQMAPSGNYGPPSSMNPASSYSGSAPAANAPVSSYSTYDQRDYREEKYRAQSSDTIYVRNLPPNFNWQNLRDRFNEVGEVRYCETKANGTALVRFTTNRDAQRACDLMNGIRIGSNPIDVDLYY